MIKRFLLLELILLLVCGVCFAQQPSAYPVQLITYPHAPFGPCDVYQVAMDVSTTTYYSCNTLTRPHTWTPFTGSISSVLPDIPIAFSSGMAFNGSSSANYSVTLTGNVTFSSITGTPINGNLMGFHICQSGGPWTFSWPGNFLNTTAIQTTGCTDATYKFNGTNWSQLIQPAGGGGGGGACSASGSQGTIQAAGTAGACQTTNLAETAGNLAVGDNTAITGTLSATGSASLASSLTVGGDQTNRGPNPGVDIRSFGARAISPNAIPASTGTINSASPTLTVASASTFVKNDGIAVVGAGAAITATTPTSPTVTPSCATQPSGLGYTTPAGAGSTSYSYSISAYDTGRGYTAASANGTTSTGNASLGANNTAWTSSASGSGNTFTATVGSTANLAAGCLVLLKGGTNDAEFGGWKIIASIVDGTHFTYNSGVDAARGISTTTATGGTVYFWLCNHLVLPAPTGNGSQYLIFGRTAGSMARVGISLIANLGLTDSVYNTWDDYGSPMMDNTSWPWWSPSTPPGAAVNDMLVTTITNISGTTFTLADNAVTSVTTSPVQFDDVPAIKAALAASNTGNTGGGGTIHFPAILRNSGTGISCYLISSYLVASVQAMYADSQICFSETMELNGNLYGTDADAISMSNPSFGIRSHTAMVGHGANPMIYLKGGSVNKVLMSLFGQNGGIEIFYKNGNAMAVLDEVTFTDSNSTGYMNIAFYDYETVASGGFGGDIRRCSFVMGPTQVDGSTSTPQFVSKFNTLWNLSYSSWNRRGAYFLPHLSGLTGRFHMGEEIQGNITPVVMVSNAENAGNVGGFFTLQNMFIDTGGHATLANLTPNSKGLGGTFVIDSANLPSAGALITGNPFVGTVTLLNVADANGLSYVAIGQNKNVIHMGTPNGNRPGIFAPSYGQSLVSYSANHTLALDEGIVIGTGTPMTFTLPHAIRGQSWQVFNNSGGTETLAIDSGTLHGNGATGSITIPANSGLLASCDGTDCEALGLGSGGGGGGCSPGGTVNATQYNNGAGGCAGLNAPVVAGDYILHYPTPTTTPVAPARDLAGIPINPQTGTTYTEGSANYQCDRGFLVTASNAGAQTYTMLNPSTACASQNFFNVLKNIGTNKVTETASGFTVNGGASLVTPQNWTRFLWSDGVNYTASRFPDFSAFPSCVGAGNAIQFDPTAIPPISCGSSASGVSSFSGDAGGVVSNSLSAGAVVLTFTNAPAHKYLGNNTGTPAAPAYFNIVDADLTAASHAALFNAANTWTGLQDFSGATWKIPTGAGFTAGATSMLGYDSTAKIPHCYVNNADGLCATTTTTSTTVTQILHATATAGIYAPSAIVSADLPSSAALAGSPTTTTQSAKDNSTKIATTAYVDAPTGLTAGTSVTLTAPRQYFICTGTCTITVPVPAAGYEFCIMNDDNVATVITLSAIGSSARYENTARTAYGTAGTGTFISGGAVGDKVCLLGRDSTHYLTASFTGTWTAN